MFFQTLLTFPVAGFPGRTSNILYRDIQADFWMQFDLSKSISVSLSSTLGHGKNFYFGILKAPAQPPPVTMSWRSKHPVKADVSRLRWLQVSHRSCLKSHEKKTTNNKQSFFCDALHVGPVILFCTGYCQAMLQKDSLHISEDSTSCTVPRRETEGWGHETGRFLN